MNIHLCDALVLVYNFNFQITLILSIYRSATAYNGALHLLLGLSLLGFIAIEILMVGIGYIPCTTIGTAAIMLVSSHKVQINQVKISVSYSYRNNVSSYSINLIHPFVKGAELTMYLIPCSPVSQYECGNRYEEINKRKKNVKVPLLFHYATC